MSLFACLTLIRRACIHSPLIALAEVAVAQAKRPRGTEGGGSKALLDAAATAHSPTPPRASARVQAKAANSAAAAFNGAAVEDSVSRCGRVRKRKMLVDM